MYFESRAKAGVELAHRLFPSYRYEDCAVVSVNDGGVLVGEQIASELHCALMLLLSQEIEVPGESVMYGSVSQVGGFTANSNLSRGEITGYESEFFGYFAEQKRESFQKLNRIVGDGGTISLDLLRDRNIILVSDGFRSGSEVDAVLDFLKPIRYQKIIAAAPVSTVDAVDKLHVLVDEIHILDVKSNYLETNHYYDNNDIPTREESVQKINEIIVNWR